MSKVRELVSLHGKAIGLSHGSHLMGDGFAGLAVGTETDGGNYYEGHGPFLKQTHFDDFLGKTISIAWNLNKGSDGSAANFAHLATTLNGVARGVTGAGAGANYATNGIQIDHGALSWEADRGSLVMEAALKVSTLAQLALYVGFTDQYSALEMPMTLGGGDALTTNCTDGCGFLFDSGADTKHLWLCGVANDVDATKQSLGVDYPTSAYQRFRVEINSTGQATFSIAGVPVGSLMTGAVTKTVPLTPVIAAFAHSAASINVDVDWIRVQQDRGGVS